MDDGFLMLICFLYIIPAIIMIPIAIKFVNLSINRPKVSIDNIILFVGILGFVSFFICACLGNIGYYYVSGASFGYKSYPTSRLLIVLVYYVTYRFIKLILGLIINIKAFHIEKIEHEVFSKNIRYLVSIFVVYLMFAILIYFMQENATICLGIINDASSF